MGPCMVLGISIVTRECMHSSVHTPWLHVHFVFHFHEHIFCWWMYTCREHLLCKDAWVMGVYPLRGYIPYIPLCTYSMYLHRLRDVCMYMYMYPCSMYVCIVGRRCIALLSRWCVSRYMLVASIRARARAENTDGRNSRALYSNHYVHTHSRWWYGTHLGIMVSMVTPSI